MTNSISSTAGEQVDVLTEAQGSPYLEIERPESWGGDLDEVQKVVIEGESVELNGYETAWLEELSGEESPVTYRNFPVGNDHFDGPLARFVKARKSIRGLRDKLKGAFGDEVVDRYENEDGLTYFSLVPLSEWYSELAEAGLNEAFGDASEEIEATDSSKDISDEQYEEADTGGEVESTNEGDSGGEDNESAEKASVPTMMSLGEGSGLLHGEDRDVGTSVRPNLETESPESVSEAEQELQEQVRQHLLCGENGLPEEGLNRWLVKRAYYEIVADPDRKVTENIVRRMKKLNEQLRKVEVASVSSSRPRSSSQNREEFSSGTRPHPSQAPPSSNGHNERSPEELWKLLEFDIDDEIWMIRARCFDADPDAFFPETGSTTREAKRICAQCPVRGECLEFALENRERFGVWGGKSQRERRRINRERKEAEDN